MRGRALAGVVALAMIWGTNFLLVDMALRGLSAEHVVLLRLALATLLLFAWLLLHRQWLPRNRRTWWRVAVLGLIGQALPWTLFAWGQQTVSSGLAGVYTGATPLLTVPLAYMLLRQRPSRMEVLGTAFGFAGIVIVLHPWETGLGGGILGQLACLGGAFCYALSFAYAGVLLRDATEAKLSLAAAQAFTSTVMLGGLGGHSLSLAPLSTTAVAVGVIGLGVGSAAAYIINYWLVATVGPVKASISFYLIPVVALITGFLLNGERFSPLELLGSALVILALVGLYEHERYGDDEQVPEAAEKAVSA